MTTEPTETDILELIKQKQQQKVELGDNWLANECIKQIALFRKNIVVYEKLLELSKNPEVMRAINLFIGKQ